MSLINEALKKVQNQNPGQGTPPTTTLPPLPPPTPPAARKPHRSFLWGFLAAVLVVGLFTSMLASFFVWQILGPDKPPASTETLPPLPRSADSLEPPPMVPEAAEPVPEAPQPEPIASEESPSPPPSADLPPPVAAPEPAPAPAREPDLPPDPQVVARLMELEIRGIMSGGIKVLIHDRANDRTRAYRVGETIEGAMGLSIAGIAPDTIQFRDYAGAIHTKSF